MTEQRLIEIEQEMNKFGPSNCWTGTSGALAAIIHELLAEVRRLKAMTDDTLPFDVEVPPAF